MAYLRFFNSYADIRFTANRLPHWQQEGAVYFITFRLADAVPHHLRTQWESERAAWLLVHPQPWRTEVQRACAVENMFCMRASLREALVKQRAD